MDLEDLDEPTKAPSRVSRFAPKSSQLKPTPKSEPVNLVRKSEPVSKTKEREPDAGISKKKEGDDEEGLKMEPLASNGDVKMEIDPKSEGEDEPVEGVEQDVVVREIDVFFNPSIDANTQLFLLQYPLRPCWRPYDLEERCREVRVKPASSQVELDISLDVDSKNYDKDFGSKLNMTKQTLSSKWERFHGKHYAIGVLIGNRLHLNPLHAAVQLRPSLEHLYSGSSEEKSNIRTNANVAVKKEESGVEKSGDSSKRQNKKLESSVEQKHDGEESWVPLKYHSSRSDLSGRYLETMIRQVEIPINFTMNPYDYVDSLCPGVSNNAKPKDSLRMHLLSLSLEERIKKLLCEETQVHRFSILKHYAPDHSEEELLGVLQQFALLVQGFWVPRSSLVFSSVSKPGRETLGRDFAVLLFSKSMTVSHSQVQRTVPRTLITSVENFLNYFGVKRTTCNDWKFREQTDLSFKKLYPDVVNKQEQVLENLEKKLTEFFARGEKDRPEKSMGSNLGMNIMPSNKGSTNSVTGVVARRTVSDDTREALPMALQKLLQIHKVCSFQKIRQGLQELAVSQSSHPKTDPRIFISAANASEEELKAVIGQVAENIHGHCVLKSSPDNPEYDQFRNLVITLLKGREAGGKLKRAEISYAVQQNLHREMSNNEYNKVMNELCVSRGSAWVLKSGDGSSK